MKVVSSREFRDHQKMYFDLASRERVVIKRKNKFLEIVPRGESIPESVSPSNDPYFDDPRNIAELEKRIREFKNNPTREGSTTIDPNKSIWKQIGLDE